MFLEEYAIIKKYIHESYTKSNTIQNIR